MSNSVVYKESNSIRKAPFVNAEQTTQRPVYVQRSINAQRPLPRGQPALESFVWHMEKHLHTQQVDIHPDQKERSSILNMEEERSSFINRKEEDSRSKKSKEEDSSNMVNESRILPKEDSSSMVNESRRKIKEEDSFICKKIESRMRNRKEDSDRGHNNESRMKNNEKDSLICKNNESNGLANGKEKLKCGLERSLSLNSGVLKNSNSIKNSNSSQVLKNNKVSKNVEKVIGKVKSEISNCSGKCTRECWILAERLLKNDYFIKVVDPEMLMELSFTVRKDIGYVGKWMMQWNAGGFLEYALEHSNMMMLLLRGYEQKEIALISGNLLRDMLQYKELCRLLLERYPEWIISILVYVCRFEKEFDVAADAFSNLNLVMTKDNEAFGKYLDEYGNVFFEKYHDLIRNGDNFMIQRQSLMVLGKLLLDPIHFDRMVQYVGNKKYLKLIMGCLRHPNYSFRIEAFHVFKVFVANPNKSKSIVYILKKNRDKLMEFLVHFENTNVDRKIGQAFQQERSLLLYTLKKLDDVQYAKQDTHSYNTPEIATNT